jgi:DNA-binding transcriptional LysR family regulator
MNGGCNAFGSGNRANATIGRAVRLIMLNVGGGWPGDLDKSNDAAASKQGITLQHAVIVTQFATMLSLVRAGLGLAIVPAGAIAVFNIDGLRTLPITGPALSRNLGLITLKEREPTPAAIGISTLIRSAWSKGRD